MSSVAAIANPITEKAVIMNALGRDSPARIQHNSITGERAILRYDRTTRERSSEILVPGSRWVADPRRAKYGLCRYEDGRYEWLLVFIGETAPIVEDPRAYKPCCEIPFFSPEHGYAEMRVAGTIAVGGLDRLLDSYAAAPEALNGDVPIVRFDEARAVPGSGGRRFFAPESPIVGWCDRERIPAFADREPVCPLPTEVPALPLSGELAKRLGGPKTPPPPRPKRQTRDELGGDLPPFDED
jgi:hypothetical protein